MTATPSAAQPALHALAERAGILAEYDDLSGQRRVTSDSTRVALLSALGFDASSDESARRALGALEAEEREQIVAPVRVVSGGGRTRGVPVSIPGAGNGRVDWFLETRGESGAVHAAEGHARPGARGTIRIPLPVVAALGYHTLRLSLRCDGQDHRAEQTLIVTPRRCLMPRDVLGGRRVFGITANLYAVRGMDSMGMGTFSELRTLLEWCGELGGAFVGVNPLHALRNTGDGISPYSPVSRLYRNILYLDLRKIPELRDSPEARACLEESDVRAELATLRASPRVEYERLQRVLLPVLRLLHRRFALQHREGGTARGRAYAGYLRREGATLQGFATFLALCDTFGDSCQTWPTPYRDPDSPEVARFQREHEEDVDFHRYLQFELDRQLAVAAEAGSEAGLAIGVYQDLAIGTAPDGADAWAFPGLFVRGASVGAPPDQLAPQGQNWTLPPLDPRRLHATAYAYWVRLVRATLRHAGALRIDHVMGLFRQFWIPDGHSGVDGAYVRFPAADLLGILALESRRAGALVVGEDLGTVPVEVPPALRAWGILSSKVLYFERTGGGFRPAADYPPLALATATTHDLPTIAAFWTGADIALRAGMGLIEGHAALDWATAARAQEKQALLGRLEADGTLPAGSHTDVTPDVVTAAAHRFLSGTPSALVGLSLDDIAGELEPVNLPGVGPDRYPSWTRRQTRTIEDLRASGVAERGITRERGARLSPTPASRKAKGPRQGRVLR